jgi:hypothetical protein
MAEAPPEVPPAPSSPWKRRAMLAAALLLALVAAFVGGRFSAPVQVIEAHVFHAFKVETVRDVVHEVVHEVQAKAETKIVYRDRVIEKDGTVREHEVERTDSKQNDEKTTDGVKVSDRATSTSVLAESSKVTVLRPSWRVALQVGASLRAPFVPIAGPLVLGVSVDYRIFGGLTAGLWLNTFGAAGVGIAFEF